MSDPVIEGERAERLLAWMDAGWRGVAALGSGGAGGLGRLGPRYETQPPEIGEQDANVRWIGSQMRDQVTNGAAQHGFRITRGCQHIHEGRVGARITADLADLAAERVGRDPDRPVRRDQRIHDASLRMAIVAERDENANALAFLALVTELDAQIQHGIERGGIRDSAKDR